VVKTSFCGGRAAKWQLSELRPVPSLITLVYGPCLRAVFTGRVHGRLSMLSVNIAHADESPNTDTVSRVLLCFNLRP